MVDHVKIYVKAGDGGNGCTSFKGVKFTRSYRPDGGNGGGGADVIIRADANLRSLEKIRFNQHVRAESGRCGQANKKKGAEGRPRVIRVPPGTIIRNLDKDLLLRDLTDPDAELVVAKGGEAGKGNTKSRLATAGLLGEEKNLSLELKLIANIALIGYPNSGKSALLAKLSSARPKVASYPFTTTSPFLAILEFNDFEEPSDLSLAEMPALARGSSQGKGLGIEFLRHAERAKLLIHLIDIAGSEGRDPLEDYKTLNDELGAYDLKMLDKPQIIVANKIDLPCAQDNLEKFRSALNKKVYPISTEDGRGIKQLLKAISNYFK